MSGLHQTLLVFAQSVTPTPDAVDVRLVDGGGDGLRLRDLLIPLGTLGAVLLAGWINRKLADTQARREDLRDRARGEREDKLDEKRAERERALEIDRERRADNADKRRAIGAIRRAREFLDRSRSFIAMALEERDVYPLEPEGWIPPPRPDDEHLMATWLSRDAWEEYTAARAAIGFVEPVNSAIQSNLNKDDEYTPPSAVWNTLVGFHKTTTKALLALQAEETRLAVEIGDPAAEHEWKPLPAHEWPPIEHDEEPA